MEIWKSIKDWQRSGNSVEGVICGRANMWLRRAKKRLLVCQDESQDSRGGLSEIEVGLTRKLHSRKLRKTERKNENTAKSTIQTFIKAKQWSPKNNLDSVDYGYEKQQ
jgi:hypothetical protein